MLGHLYIKNVALIREADIDLFEGLNILSGETGAGKSMVIDSIKFLLGEKVDRDFLRTGTTEALVEGLFMVGNDSIAEALKERGINVGEDKAVLISRTVNAQNRSAIKINGKTAAIAMVKEISHYFLDFHSQHQHQSLLNPAKHIELLDKFCKEELASCKADLSDHLKSYRELSKKISQVSDSKSGGSRLEFIQFQIEEIEGANLQPGEEEELNDRRRLLLNSEKLIDNTRRAIDYLYGEEGDGALYGISGASRLISYISEDDSILEPLLEQIDNAYNALEDAGRVLKKYYDNLDHDPRELANIESRLDLLYDLKRKYGRDIEAILAYYDKIMEEREFLINSEKLLGEYKVQKRELNKKIIDTCSRINGLRCEQGQEIEKKIVEVLHELGMKDAEFKINIQKKKEFSSNGNDKVEFLISPNPGEDLKELSKIASGGEISRIMLALKSVLSDAELTETFIFDEIDAGVSGQTAQKVAEKLALIGEKKQIICISHLPQIAAMADNHYLIEKRSENNKTETNINALDYEGATMEIARLLGGAEITEAAKAAAVELKNSAANFKESL